MKHAGGVVVTTAWELAVAGLDENVSVPTENEPHPYYCRQTEERCGKKPFTTPFDRPCETDLMVRAAVPF